MHTYRVCWSGNAREHVCIQVVAFIAFLLHHTENDIGAEGAKALAPGLKLLTQLMELYLYGKHCNCVKARVGII